MRRTFIIFGLVTLSIIAGGIFFSTRPAPPTATPTSYEYFWGDGCPHCVTVEEFMNSWDGKDKVNIEKKEVWKDKANASLMAKRASACGIAQKDLGVPMLYTLEGKCIIGDEPIIGYFKKLEL